VADREKFITKPKSSPLSGTLWCHPRHKDALWATDTGRCRVKIDKFLN